MEHTPLSWEEIPHRRFYSYSSRACLEVFGLCGDRKVKLTQEKAPNSSTDLEEYPTTPDSSTLNRNGKPPRSTRRQTHLKICVIDIFKHQSRGL